jgi:hypothetical protein
MVGAARRAALLLLALLVWPALPASAQSLTIEPAGEAIKIRAPGLSFLEGEPVARLKDGRSVRVELAAMALPAPGRTPVTTIRRIFSLSYDLWEERFAVSTVGARAQSVSHLALAAVEAWCVEQLAIPLSALAPLGRDAQFWIRLEYRLLDGDAEAAADSPDAGYTLQGLIDILSRRRKADSSPHAVDGGPFRTPRAASATR